MLTKKKILIIAILIIYIFHGKFLFAAEEKKVKTVVAVILTRNKAHILPLFLTLFTNLNYPKNRISLFIRCDHSADNSCEIIKEWLEIYKNFYHSTDVVFENSTTYFTDEISSFSWTTYRFKHMITLKDEAFNQAKKMWADFIWFIDSDVLLVEPDVLKDMVSHEKAIIAPMLNSLWTYSNYWCAMSNEYWYKRTEDYLPILERRKTGCFSVPMIHSCVIIDLQYSISDLYSFNPNNTPNYAGPYDDIISFAIKVKNLEQEMFICNDKIYGYIPPTVDESNDFDLEDKNFVSLQLELFINYPDINILPKLVKYVKAFPDATKLKFDNIYLINLERRPDRLKRMIKSFDLLGIDVEVFKAVDGKKLNERSLNDIGMKPLLNYKDPWSKRDMTYGEIGCFLSHYYIWKDIVEKQYEKVIIFEDDIRFKEYFLDNLYALMNEVKDINLQWDLIYLGRKVLNHTKETWVEEAEMLVYPYYTHWTLGYILTLNGARKLLKPNPLKRMIPVDEYIPIMFNQHPNESWKKEYTPRDLKAYSVEPLLVKPTHYTGEKGYISDTEASPIVDEKLIKSDSVSYSAHKNEKGNSDSGVCESLNGPTPPTAFANDLCG